MTPDEQRIAMAELCPEMKCALCGYPMCTESRANVCSAPHYDPVNDLNAMFEADKWAREVGMNADQWEAYGRALYDAHPTAHIRNPDGTLDFYDLASLLTELTAAQRREAFLRTMGKWKE